MKSPVLFLSRSGVTKNLDPRALVGRLVEAFQLHSARDRKKTPSPQIVPLANGSLLASSVGALEGIPAYTVKVETRSASRSPGLAGFVHLFCVETGRLLAVFESSYISSVGSALTAALAADLLASSDAASMALVGNGTQGWLGLRFLMEMRELTEVRLFDLNRRKSLRIAERLDKYEGLKVRVCDSLTEAVSSADIVHCSTWSRRAFLYSEMIKPGAHVSTLGADEKGKKELSAELLRTCSFFCDDRELARSVGPLHGVKNIKNVPISELGEVLTGDSKGRKDHAETTVYGAVGLPFVDLVAAWVTYKKASKRGKGKTLPYLS